MKNIFLNIRSLRAKSLTLITLSVISVMILFSFFSLLVQRNTLLSEQVKRTGNIADRLAFTMSQPLWNLDREYLKELMNHEVKAPEITAIVLIMNDNEFFMGRMRQSVLDSNVVDINSEEQIKSSVTGVPITRTILREGKPIGTIKLYITNRFINKELLKDVLHEMLQGLIQLVCIGFLVYLGMNRTILKPLKRLSETANELEHGHLSARATELSDDEIGQLGSSINAMAETLDESFQNSESLLEELREQNDNLLIAEDELRMKVEELILSREQLQQNEEKYRELVEHANSIILRWGADGNIHFFNEFAEKTFGYSRDEVLGKNIVGTIVPETETSGRDLAALIENITTYPENYLSNENENVCKSGERIWISWANKAIFSDNGQLKELLSIGQNITEKRMLEQQIIQQQKLEGIGMLAGGMAHDINNLLTPIFISTEMALRKIPGDHPIKPKLAIIDQAAIRIKELVAQVLLFSRKQHSELKPVDLNSVMTDFMGILLRTIRENISMDLKTSQDPCMVMADSTQLEQIFMNLAVNAQDAIDGVGKITVETGHLVLDTEYCAHYPGIVPGRYAMLAFTDTGCGMDEETRFKVFEPFFTTKQKGKGTGLGLSTVYGIVRQHGGHLDVLSRLGSGTTFRIFLPMLDTLSATVSIKSPVVSGANSLFAGTLLLVEDNAMLRESILEALTENGIKTISAASPREALTIFKERGDEISALLTDVIMPEMNGPVLYSKLQKLRPNLPVLFMSGYASDIEQYEEISENPAIFISKPFTIQLLMLKISAINSSDNVV